MITMITLKISVSDIVRMGFSKKVREYPSMFYGGAGGGGGMRSPLVWMPSLARAPAIIKKRVNSGGF